LKRVLEFSDCWLMSLFLGQEIMTGGVNSPVSAFKSVGGQPIVFDSVKGSHMKDIDGNDYIDYVGSWGPAIIGHADDGGSILLLHHLHFKYL